MKIKISKFAKERIPSQLYLYKWYSPFKRIEFQNYVNKKTVKNNYFHKNVTLRT